MENGANMGVIERYRAESTQGKDGMYMTNRTQWNNEICTTHGKG
jgi:hypothetical protein